MRNILNHGLFFQKHREADNSQKANAKKVKTAHKEEKIESATIQSVGQDAALLLTSSDDASTVDAEQENSTNYEGDVFHVVDSDEDSAEIDIPNHQLDGIIETLGTDHATTFDEYEDFNATSKTAPDKTLIHNTEHISSNKYDLLYQNALLTNQLLMQIITKQDAMMEAIDQLKMASTAREQIPKVTAPNYALNESHGFPLQPFISNDQSQTSNQVTSETLTQLDSIYQSQTSNQVTTCSETLTQLDSICIDELSMESLLALKEKACSEGNFAVHLLREFFRDEELKNKNVSGKKGKEPLDPARMGKIRACYFKMYPCNREQEKHKWSRCTESINTYLRGKKNVKS